MQNENDYLSLSKEELIEKIDNLNEQLKINDYNYFYLHAVSSNVNINKDISTLRSLLVKIKNVKNKKESKFLDEIKYIIDKITIDYEFYMRAVKYRMEAHDGYYNSYFEYDKIKEAIEYNQFNLLDRINLSKVARALQVDAVVFSKMRQEEKQNFKPKDVNEFIAEKLSDRVNLLNAFNEIIDILNSGNQLDGD